MNSVELPATWSLVVRKLAELLCVIAVFAYAATRRSDGSRARKFGLTGVVLMFSDVFLIDLIRLILVRNLPITERAAVEVACIGWHCLLFSSSAMFLVAAVFTGRDVTKPADAIAELPKSFVADNPNPYQPPGQ